MRFPKWILGLDLAPALPRGIGKTVFETSPDISLIFKFGRDGVQRLQHWNVAAASYPDLALRPGATVEEVFNRIKPSETGVERAERIAVGLAYQRFAIVADIGSGARSFDIIHLPLSSNQMLVTARDVTAAKAFEAATLETGRIFESIAPIAHLGIWQLDLALGVYHFSPEACRIFGVQNESCGLAKERLAELSHPDDLRANAAAFETDAHVQHRIVRPNGETRDLITRSVIERGPDGRILRHFGIVIDVSDLKLADKALRDSEARYRVLAETAEDVIWSVDMDGVILFVTGSCAIVMGYAPEDLVGQKSGSLMHPDDRSGLMKLRKSAEVRKVGPEATFEFRFKRSDGVWIWLEGRPSPLLDPETNQQIGYQDTLRDVSARKALEAELMAAREAAEAAARAKGDFLANMSHELRTPLTSIIGFAELLAGTEDLAETPLTYASRIREASGALLTVINDVLDFSKLEAGRFDLEEKAFDPGQVVVSTVALMQMQAKAKGLHLATEIDPELPTWILGDGARLRQVLLNLVGNAVKFTSEGAVQVVASYINEDGRPRLKIDVSDTGLGIAADAQLRLFERFSQADTSINRKFGGTGLGLAISRRLVELMKGELSVRSRLGGGSTFSFWIPAHEAQEAANPGSTFQEDHQAEGDFGTIRILLTDDTDVNRELMRAILAPLGADIIEARSGDEAIALAAQQAFDIILMDVHMPGTDGLAAARAIRAREGAAHHTPIIAVTADVLPENVRACREAGMDDEVAKPISPAELISKILTWLGDPDSRAAADSGAPSTVPAPAADATAA